MTRERWNGYVTLRHDLIDPAIKEHGGRIVQTGGDSLLIVFDSIDGAVRCAVKVQGEVPGLDGDRSPDSAIRFRVGINLGDAIADGTDLHGDAVNVVARLQAECPPGGICVSRSVRDHVHGRLGLDFQDLGALDLKNIARPVEAFAVKLDAAGTVVRPLVESAAATRPLPEMPSIAVLPFTNMSRDPEQEYLSDGIVEEIITTLSRVRWFSVISRNSSFALRCSRRLIFASDGRFSNILLRSDLPKFKQNNRNEGSPDENAAVVHGSIAYFGTYALDGATLKMHVDASTFPNWTGTDQARTVHQTGNQLVWENAAA